MGALRTNMRGLLNKVIREGVGFDRLLDQLEANASMSTDDMREYQLAALKRLLQHCNTNVPYYSRLFKECNFDPDKVQDLRDIEKLPLLTKQDVKKNFNELIAVNANKKLCRIGQTSGTTGSPARFYRDVQSIILENAALWRFWQASGFNIGEKRVTLRGDNVRAPQHGRYWVYNMFENQLIMSSLHLSRANIAAYYQKIKGFQAEALQAYPSSAYILAKFLAEPSQTVRFEHIFTSSEPFSPAVREFIERQLGGKVWDMYGMAERVVLATECAAHSGLHINEDYSYVEIVNRDLQNTATAGTIVGTTLHNYAMPLLRYVTNDLGELMQGECTCGRCTKRLKPIETKVDDVIRTPDGRWISPSAINAVLKTLNFVFESQVIQVEPDRIVVKVVPEAGYGREQTKSLLDGLRQRLGPVVKIDVERVGSILRTASGKFRGIVNEIHKECG